jgi:hypothetical protein
LLNVEVKEASPLPTEEAKLLRGPSWRLWLILAIILILVFIGVIIAFKRRRGAAK